MTEFIDRCDMVGVVFTTCVREWSGKEPALVSDWGENSRCDQWPLTLGWAPPTHTHTHICTHTHMHTHTYAHTKNNNNNTCNSIPVQKETG